MPRACVCDRVVKGKEYQRGRDCAKCWNYWHVRAFHLQQGGSLETLLPDPRPPCACGCAKCPPPAPNPPPLSVARITAADLGHPAGDWVSNASIVRWGGRLLLAYRHKNCGADVWVRPLREDLTPAPGESVKLHLSHPAARFGREDPRWFVFRDRLHVCYAGVQGKTGPTQILYARLREDLTVEAVFACPKFGEQWQKNWGFFEGADGDLHAVYTIKPHVVLRVEGERAWVVAESPNPLPWSGGLLRGGASPVRVGDRFVSWFHGRRKYQNLLTYTTGVYEFAAEPPFAPLAQTPHPVIVGDHANKPADWYCANWFPCGAVLDADSWLVSAGCHDREIEIARWGAAQLSEVCRVRSLAESAT